MEDTPAPLAAALAAAVGEGRVLTRAIDRIAWASDASFYRLVPGAVVHASSTDEVRRLFAVSRAYGVPLVFRAAGTSLSGQSVTDGVLVETARGFRARRGRGRRRRRIRVQPGVIGAHANRALRPFGRKIGPDPASIATCTLGGILANNASGMCCGVAQNAYHTLESPHVPPPVGHRDRHGARQTPTTSCGRRSRRSGRASPSCARAILARRPVLAGRIRAKYRTKNTTGYALNAFLDFERPVDVFARLLVGSEGTLAFLAEAVLRTVPGPSGQGHGPPPLPGPPRRLRGDRPAERRRREGARGHGPRGAALGRGASPACPRRCARCRPAPRDSSRSSRPRRGPSATRSPASRRAAAAGLTLLEPARFTHDAAEQARLWRVRQGMFPSVGAVRKSGTTVIIEDVAFPVERLADAATDLRDSSRSTATRTRSSSATRGTGTCTSSCRSPSGAAQASSSTRASWTTSCGSSSTATTAR